ncbi:Bcr/CflA family drug resistance efflux transporter [bacterium]|nr:MAG: Bcr/CflA family drug resistance efflux transporter [bacterium]
MISVSTSKPGFAEFVALMAFMTSLVALSIDAMLPALPMIGSDLGVQSENATQMVVTMLLVGMAVGQVIYGPVSDSVGRKPPVYAGLAIFLLGSLISLIATDFRMMLAGRLLQGLGVAGPRSVSIALIRDLHAGRNMARVMSLIMSVFVLVPIIAPVIGQGILMLASWRAIFALFLVLGLLVLGWFGLRQPESLSPEHRKPFSLASILRGFLAVLRQRAAIGFTLTSGLFSGAFVGYLSSSQQVFQDTYSVGPRFALWFALLAASIGVASLVNGRLVLRLGMYHLATLALRTLSGLSIVFLAWSWWNSGVPEFALFMTYMIAAFFCVGIVFGNINSLAMEPLGEIAGVGAAVVSSLSLTISVGLGALIGMSYDGTILPMVGGFAILSTLSLPLMVWAAKGRPA